MKNDLPTRVSQILHVYSMVERVSHVGVAVSGGADSVVLLHILHGLAEAVQCRLTVLHVNHQLRGAESDADEAFVRALAASLNLPALVESSAVPPGNLEQEARRIRQRFFQSCRLLHGVDRVALGHTQSDQAETVLFRLFRGAGITGLAGMQPVTKSGLIRPLLFSSREEIRSFAISEKLQWRDDASNRDLRFRRNRLRLVTVPQLKTDYGQALEMVLTRTAQIAGGEEAFWAARTARLYRRFCRWTPYGLTVSTLRLKQLAVAEQRRLLRHCILKLRSSLRSVDSSHIEGILAICSSEHGHDRLMIPGVDALRSFDTLLLAHPATPGRERHYSVPIPLETSVLLPFQAGEMIVLPGRMQRDNCVTVKDTTEVFFDESLLDRDLVKLISPSESLQVRNWEPGDRWQKPGASHPEKIKTLFQQYRVVLWERRHWPVLIIGGAIAWVRAFGTDARFCPATEGANVLRVRFRQADHLTHSASESKHRSLTSL